MDKTILISGSSDIGMALSRSLSTNSKIISTYNSTKKKIRNKNIKYIHLDIKNIQEIDEFSKKKEIINWDNLILLPASQLPIGLANEVSPKEWLDSINLNFSHQIYLLLKILNKKSKKKFKRIILWSGTGSNNAPKYYSAYTVSKIALTKITELFDAELKDCIFSVIGPGWVRTKIHKETLMNKRNSRENYFTTKYHLKNNIFNSMESVVNCVLRIMRMSKEAVGGRNFSVQYDKWRDKEFENFLKTDDNIYKLRRDFNSFSSQDLNFNLDDILNFFDKNKKIQNPKSLIYQTFNKIFKIKIQKSFLKRKFKIMRFNVDYFYSIKDQIKFKILLNLSDFFLFKLYQKKKNYYKRIYDIGCKYGLHSLVFKKLGFKVYSYDNNKDNLIMTKKIFKNNKCKLEVINNLKIIEKLQEKFELFRIDVKNPGSFISKYIKPKKFNYADFVVNISSKKDAQDLWKHLKKKNMYSQKNSWQKVVKFDQLPISYSEGSLIISKKLNW